MKQIIELYAKRRVNVNNGYKYVKKDYVYVPIIQTYLDVTKRDFFNLPLLEEIVLQLVNENIHTISELVNILGIERNILEITLADLSVKDLISCSADSCSILPKGKMTLRELMIIQRSKEKLKNIFMNPINEKIILDYQNYTFVEKIYGEDEKKLQVNFSSDDISIYRRNMDAINKIFLEETNIYNDKTKAKQPELISIDKIDKVFIKFLKVPFYIYVSENGFDIDLISADEKKESLFLSLKSEIVTQICKHQILTTIFTRYPLRKKYSMYRIEERTILRDLSKEYYRKQSDQELLIEQIHDEIFADRRLIDDEFELIIMLIQKESERITINVDYLDEWCYSNSILKGILKKIDSKIDLAINYRTASNFEQCIKNLSKVRKIDRAHIVQKMQELPYFSINFDDKYEIIDVPEDIAILDEGTHIYKHNMFFIVLEKRNHINDSINTIN